MVNTKEIGMVDGAGGAANPMNTSISDDVNPMKSSTNVNTAGAGGLRINNLSTRGAGTSASGSPLLSAVERLIKTKRQVTRFLMAQEKITKHVKERIDFFLMVGSLELCDKMYIKLR